TTSPTKARRPAFAFDPKIKSRMGSPRRDLPRNWRAAAVLRGLCDAGTSFFFGAAISPPRIACLRARLRGAATPPRTFLVSPAPMASYRSASRFIFAEHAFPLHSLLRDAKNLIDVVIADEDLHRVVLRRLFRRNWS